MATYPPRRLLGARPLPSDPRRDPRRSGFPEGGGGGGGRWERRRPAGRARWERRLRPPASSPRLLLTPGGSSLLGRRYRPRGVGGGCRPSRGRWGWGLRGLGAGKGALASARPPAGAERVCVPCGCQGRRPTPARTGAPLTRAPRRRPDRCPLSSLSPCRELDPRPGWQPTPPPQKEPARLLQEGRKKLIGEAHWQIKIQHCHIFGTET
ncbi:translation initiation factor IF-2-like [Dipodomys spectabilis]|uniref:translation initiation factor IF-2-like n=1 Tax=Dipodomys spectabilis TaxID=105255 RepID=UPI001C544DAF|nr:translation initiation factor IF-2-like [Dipodomys spectabilis]